MGEEAAAGEGRLDDVGRDLRREGGPVRGQQHGREVPAGGVARNTEALRIGAERLRVAVRPGDGRPGPHASA